MQTMNDDAQAVSKITHFKLQMAGEVNAPVIVGGFPLSGMDKSIGKLLRAGHSIAIAMQDENKERHITEIIRVQCQRFS